MYVLVFFELLIKKLLVKKSKPYTTLRLNVL